MQCLVNSWNTKAECIDIFGGLILADLTWAVILRS